MDSPEDAIVRAGLLFVGARALTDLDGAIALLRSAVGALDDPRPALRLLASAFQARYEFTGSAADLEACNDSLTALLDGPADPDGPRTHTEAWLGLNLARRHLDTGDPQDRDRAVRLLARSHEGLPELPPEIAARVPHHLGLLLLARSAGRPGPDLDESVVHLRRAAALAPRSPVPLRHLCQALAHQWHRGSRPALDALISARRVLSPLLAGPDREANDEALGIALAERYLLGGSAADRAEAVAALVVPGRRAPVPALLLARVLAAGPTPGDDDLAHAQRLLSWLVRSPGLSDDDRSTARSLLEETGRRRAEAHAVPAAADHARAALADARRARLLGREADQRALHDAIAGLPADDPRVRALTVELALAVAGRGVERTTAREEELVSAVHVLTRSLLDEGVPRGTWVECGERLALALYRLVRSHWAGTVGHEVLTVTAHDVDEWSRAVHGAIVQGLGLLLRPDPDAERAVDLLEQGHAGLPEGHRLRDAASLVLGLLLSERSGPREDGRAARYLDEAARQAPDAEGVHILRAAQQVRTASRRGGAELAEQAIAALESALSGLSTVDPWYPCALEVLGCAWYLRGRLTGTDDDRVRGCRLLVAAWKAAPLSHPHRDRLRRAAAEADRALSSRRWPRSLHPGGCAPRWSTRGRDAGG